MRSLIASVGAAINSPSVAIVQLVKMELSPTLYLNTSGWHLQWGGQTWLGAGRIGSIGQVEDAAGEVRGLSFTMSGVPLDMIALVLGEDVQHKPVTLYTAVCDATTGQILDAMEDWAGRLDAITSEEDHSSQTATISVTAEHAGIDLLRPRTVRYSDSDQRRLFPGDRGLEYLVDQAEAQIVWPAASYFKR